MESWGRGEAAVRGAERLWTRGGSRCFPDSRNGPAPSWWGPLVDFSSWPEIPAFNLRRYKGGSANLAVALRLWQTRDFSNALCSAKPKMCLARNPCLIFKPLCIFYVNLIHMVLIYFHLTHPIELGAIMMNGNNADFQEDF